MTLGASMASHAAFRGELARRHFAGQDDLFQPQVGQDFLDVFQFPLHHLLSELGEAYAHRHWLTPTLNKIPSPFRRGLGRGQFTR